MPFLHNQLKYKIIDILMIIYLVGRFQLNLKICQI